MIEDPNLIGFGYVLWLASLVLILGVVGSGAIDRKILKHDPLLRDRMNQLGISNWQALRQTSGLSAVRLGQIRRGELGRVTLADLAKLASALNWTTAELEAQLGILSSPVTALSRVSENSGQLEELRQQCQRLREELQQQKSQVVGDVRDAVFEQLQTLLTNYPTARQMTQAKPDLPAKNLMSLLTPLDNLLESWEYQPIGKAWERVAYDPQLHQADSDEIKAGDWVYIRFVGYREGDRIICPAKVSRTLPGGMSERSS